jgi:long-chain acyl-CoA synthetase
MADEVAAAFRAAMRLGEHFALADSMTSDDVPGWDSIGQMNLVMELESRFKVRLDTDEINAVDSVGAVRALVVCKQADRRGSGEAAGTDGMRPTEPLVHSLLAWAEAAPERPALVSEGDRIAWGPLARMVLTAAAHLRDAGVSTGDRVLLCGPNSLELAAAYFAIHAAGGVATPVDADMPADRAQEIAADSEARLAIVARDFSLPIRTENLYVLCRRESGVRPAYSPRCDMEDVADLLYTSGTTVRRKGVVLTHGQIAQAALNINAFLATDRSDVELVPIPLSHSFGLGRLRCFAQSGHTLAIEAGMRNPAKVLKRLLDLRATGLVLVPAGFELILRMTRERLAEARSHLRYAEIGSAPMRIQIKRQLMELLPRTRICHHYGLTEASRAAFIEYHSDRERLSSIGRPSPNVQIAVRDDKGRDVPAGEYGELAVRGGMVMKEYWKQPDLTREVLRDGWLRTGDWGFRDVDGYLNLNGRKTDLVNVGGMKVSPEEVEAELDSHPAVVESACVGVPDPHDITGECIKASIVTRSEISEAELVRWLRGRLEEFKIPRVWTRVDRIARTPLGKIQRHST